MKTFFVTAYLGQPHGSAKSARDFARALLATQDRVCIVSPQKENFGELAAGYALSAPHWYKYVPKRKLSLESPLPVRRNTLSLLQRWRLQSEMKGQCIIVNGWASYAYWREMAVTEYKSVSLIVRESPRYFEFRDRDGTFDMMLSGLSKFDNLIFVSDRLRQEWTKYDQLASKPTYYFPNCCEEEDIARLKQSNRKKIRHQLGFLDEEIVFICPGNIEEGKGLDLIIKVLPELVEAIPNAKLLILGDAATDWGRSLINEVSGWRYVKHIVLIPAQPSALEYLYASDVLLFPSRAEAMPRTILEGMAFGMPIVASDVDGIPELIKDGESGWLFPRDDTAVMLTRILAAVTQKAERDKYALQAEQRYRTHYSRRSQIERMFDLKKWLASE